MVEAPPAVYAHRYHGPVIERVLPLAEARRACGHMGARADACAWTSRGKCYIVIPSNGPVKDLGAYRRHEIAHCNGWSHSHGSGHDLSCATTPAAGEARQRLGRHRRQRPDFTQ
jgi:hypothetical protein